MGVLTAEAVDFGEIQSLGGLSRCGRVGREESRMAGRNGESIICVNPVSFWFVCFFGLLLICCCMRHVVW